MYHIIQPYNHFHQLTNDSIWTVVSTWESSRETGERMQGWRNRSTWGRTYLGRRYKYKYKLDQVYCAWLIKWIIKGEIIQLCLTKWWIISGTSRYWVSIRRYCLVLGGTGSVKTGTAWYYMVQGQQRACLPVYIGKSGDLVGWHQCLTYIQTTEYSAPQLVDSIKFKLSHTIFFFKEHQQKYLCIMFYFFRHSDQRQKHGHNLLWNYGYWLLSKLWDIFLLLPSFFFLILLGYSSPRTQQQVIIIIIIA